MAPLPVSDNCPGIITCERYGQSEPISARQWLEQADPSRAILRVRALQSCRSAQLRGGQKTGCSLGQPSNGVSPNYLTCRLQDMPHFIASDVESA